MAGVMTNRSEAWEKVERIRREHGEDSQKFKLARSKFYREYGCSSSRSRRRIELKNQVNGSHKHNGESRYSKRKPDPNEN